MYTELQRKQDALQQQSQLDQEETNKAKVNLTLQNRPLTSTLSPRPHTTLDSTTASTRKYEPFQMKPIDWPVLIQYRIQQEYDRLHSCMG